MSMPIIDIRYVFGFALVLLGFAWTAIGMLRDKHLISKIKTLARRDTTTVGSFPLDYWLDQFHIDTQLPFAPLQSCVLSYLGRDYFFVSGIMSYITAGRFGPLLGRSTLWCVVAVGSDAINVLSAQPRIFKRLGGSDQLVVFGVRRLSKFLEMLREPTGLGRK